MNRNSLVAILKANPNIEWKERRFNSNEETILWTKIIVYKSLAGTQHSIGLTVSGFWCSEYSDGFHITNLENYFSFVTILEMQRKVFLSEFKKCIFELSLPENIIYTFPFDELMLAAMKHGGHWALLAEQWLENGYPLSPQIIIEFPNHILVKRESARRMELITNA